jgi:hypothetical protein
MPYGYYSFKIVGNAYVNGFMYTNTNMETVVPPLMTNYDVFLTAFFVDNIPGTSNYRIERGVINSISPLVTTSTYLCSNSYGSNALFFKPKNLTGGLDQWAITPKEKFQLVSVKYSKEYTDNISSEVVFMKTIHGYNKNGPGIIYIEEALSEQITETSTFSEVQGVKMTNKITASANISFPVIKTLSGSFSVETSNEHSLAYTTTRQTSKTKTISTKLQYQVPPYTDIDIEIYAVKYNAAISYTATLRGVESGRVINLKGKWNGNVADEHLYIIPKEVKSGTRLQIEGQKGYSDLVKMFGNNLERYMRK